MACRLARLGAWVSLCARNADALEKARLRLEEEGATAIATPADVTRADQVERLVRATSEQLGEIDILVNNAGVGWFGPVVKASEADWDGVLDTNLKGAFLLLRAVAPAMMRRRRGHIINIGSLAGKSGFAGGAVYCASKWGLLGMTYSAAEDLREYGIRVSALCPGSVQTEFSSPSASRDPKKMLQPDDVAHAVEMIVLQRPESFISEVLLRPTQKP